VPRETKEIELNSTLILAAVAIVFALVFQTQAQDFPATAQRMPVLVTWIVIGLALLMIVEELLKRRLARRTGTPAGEQEDEPLPAINWPVMGLFSAATVAYVALVPWLGYLLATPLFVSGGALLSQTLRWSQALLLGLGATATVWGVFIWALKLPVPLLPAFG
jgi:hypothetical protein